MSVENNTHTHTHTHTHEQGNAKMQEVAVDNTDTLLPTEKQLESIAERCRPEISDWLDKQGKIRSTRRHTSTLWKAELIQIVVRKNLFTPAWRHKWRDVFKAMQVDLVAKYPQQSQDIAKWIKKNLLKCPVTAFVTSQAYLWLKYLQTHPPGTHSSSWYPHLAIQVAHKAFRLQSKLATFNKYLLNPSRRKMIHSLHLSVEGVSRSHQNCSTSFSSSAFRYIHPFCSHSFALPPHFMADGLLSSSTDAPVCVWECNYAFGNAIINVDRRYAM